MAGQRFIGLAALSRVTGPSAHSRQQRGQELAAFALSCSKRSSVVQRMMCPPTYFDVTYCINPWMDVNTAVDTNLAMRQWSTPR